MRVGQIVGGVAFLLGALAIVGRGPTASARSPSIPHPSLSTTHGTVLTSPVPPSATSPRALSSASPTPARASVGSALSAESSTSTASRALSASFQQVVGVNPLVMLNATTGFVWGYWHTTFSVWNTTDGGQHWRRYSVPTAPGLAPVDQTIPVVTFLSRQVGWIAWVDAGSHASTLHVLSTHDGGRQWTLSTQKVSPVVVQLEQIDFWNGEIGWIWAMSWVGSFQGDPSILQTTNGGHNWQMVSAATGYVPNPQATPDALPELSGSMPMTFTSPQTGWVAVGSYAPNAPQPTIYRTVTGGKRWIPHHLPVPPAFRKKNFSSQAYSPVFSGTDGTVLIQFVGSTTAKANAVVAERTTDSGQTWGGQRPLATPGQSWGDLMPSFINANQGWVIGEHGRLFAHTTNGGRAWQTVPLAEPLQTLLAHHYAIQQLDMVRPKIGWIMLRRLVGQNGRMITKFFKTTDGGRTWTVQSLISH